MIFLAGRYTRDRCSALKLPVWERRSCMPGCGASRANKEAGSYSRVTGSSSEQAGPSVMGLAVHPDRKLIDQGLAIALYPIPAAVLGFVQCSIGTRIGIFEVAVQTNP